MVKLSKDSNTTIFIIVFVVLLVIGLGCVWGKKFGGTAPPPLQEGMNYGKTSVVTAGSNAQPTGELELIVGDDGADSFEMVGDYEESADIGVGMGPGLYGSGRHSSDMFG